MTIISEHNSKEEGEGHDGEGSRVSLLVVGNTVRVNNQLEEGSYVIALNIRRRIQIAYSFSRVELLEYCSDIRGELFLNSNLIDRGRL